MSLSAFSRLCFAGLTLLAAVAHAFDHTHDGFDAVVKAHVRDGLVDYAGLQAAPAPLDAYLARLAAVPRSEFSAWSEPERLAFLINLYNAATLKLIIAHYPLKSIRGIGLLPGAAWKQEGVALFGGKVSLDHVEHGLIRKDFREARVHFALVCAARSCPPLRAEAFTATRLDAQLADQGRIFLGDPAKNRVDLATRTVYLSEIFQWFAADFVAASGSVMKFVTPFFPAATQRALAAGDFKVVHPDYDWSLNEQGKK